MGRGALTATDFYNNWIKTTQEETVNKAILGKFYILPQKPILLLLPNASSLCSSEPTFVPVAQTLIFLVRTL